MDTLARPPASPPSMDVFGYSSPSPSPVGCHSSCHSPFTAAAATAGDPHRQHQHHQYRTPSVGLSTPAPTPPGSPSPRTLSQRPSHTRVLSGSHRLLPMAARTSAASESPTSCSGPSPSCPSLRALVTPWERSPIHQPAILGSGGDLNAISDLDDKPGATSGTFTKTSSLTSLSKSLGRPNHSDRLDPPSRPRAMSPVAVLAQPTLHASPSNTFLGAAFARASSMSKSHHSWRGAGAARPLPASAFTTRPAGMATQMPVLARRNKRIGYSSWSPRWIVIDHVDGVLHVYKDPHALVPSDSIQVSSSHTTIQHAIDRNTGLQMLKVYYLSSRYRFRTDPNVIHAWHDTIPDLALRPGTSPSNIHTLLIALQRSATATERAPVWIPARAASTGPGSSQVSSSSLPNSYPSSSASDSGSSGQEEVDLDLDASTNPEAWSAPPTLSRAVPARKTPAPLVLRPMSAMMRRPASAPLLSPTSEAAATGSSTTPNLGMEMASPWHRETASAGFLFSPQSSSSDFYESVRSEPYSVASTRSSTGSKYMDELLFLDPYFQAQKHPQPMPQPIANAAEAQAFRGGHLGTPTPLNPFADH